MPGLATVTESQWDILWHSLGMDGKTYRRSLKWWLDNDNHRNHFAVEPESKDANLAALVGIGYMRKGRPIPGGMIYYHVTEAGIKAARDEFIRVRARVR